MAGAGKATRKTGVKRGKVVATAARLSFDWLNVLFPL